MRKLSPLSTNQDRLARLRDQGENSEVLLMRLALIETEGMRKDLGKIKGKTRVHPQILPTQASLRWSTKEPNLGGFTREFWTQHQEIIYPDPGTWWLAWDWKAIEGRLFTAYSGDEEDLLLYQIGPDPHTFTCSKYLFEWAPDALPGCSEAALNLPTDWKGGDDERRVRAKNFRFGPYQYGQGARAILGMPGIEKLGLDRTILVRRAERFLQARPKGVAWKHQTWEACVRDKEARTFMGARRKLFGKAEDMAKDGLNHMIQGSVSNLMAWCLIEILKAYPPASLVLNRHDGAILAFPDSLAQGEIMPKVKAFVEKEWEVGAGVTMSFPATWKVHANA